MKVTAVVGAYRVGGAADAAVEEILKAAREAGAVATKVYLLDKRIEFCTNCRTCTQSPGTARGQCPIDDDMSALLDELEQSDAIILASPMNFWTVTAVMKRFVERLVCYAYWPWGSHAPKPRNAQKTKRAVVVVTSAAPAPIARLSSGMVGLLKRCAALFGAKTIGVLAIGLVAESLTSDIGDRARRKAACLGRKLAAPAKR